MPGPLAIRRVQQKEAHCGPATLEMLFSFYGLTVSQEAVAEAAGMAEIIVDAEGMRIDELNDAVKALYPDHDYVLLARYNSSIQDLALLTEELRLPVGVEWQGKFIQPDGSQADQGHYSVVTSVDWDGGIIKLVDPEEKNVLACTGEIPIKKFEARWWEVDIVPLPDDRGITQVIQMDRLIFALVSQDKAQSLLELGFRPALLSLVWDYCAPLESTE